MDADDGSDGEVLLDGKAAETLEEISDEEVAETLEDGHPLLQEVPTLVRILLREFEAWRNCQGSSGSNKATKPNSSNSGDNSSSSEHNSSNDGRASTGSKKRRQELDEETSDNEGFSTKNTKRPKIGNDEEESPLLACPFYKRDEFRHQKCLKHVLRMVKNVKEHLRRCHKQPSFCPLCGQIFSYKAELDNHIRARTCDAREFQEPEGITEDHERSFRSKVDKKLTLSEQWKSVWKIIFPEEEPPESPFIEGTLHEGLACFRRFRNERGPAIISEYIRAYVESYSPADSISNPERTLEALLETVSGRAMDAVIEAYYDNLSAPQDDNGMASTENSGISPIGSNREVTQGTGLISHSQEPVKQLTVSDVSSERNADIPTEMSEALNPDQIAGENFGLDLFASSGMANMSDILIWQGLHEEDLGIDGANPFYDILDDTVPNLLAEDTSTLGFKPKSSLESLSTHSLVG
ncbi:hypothetical protein F5Y19DRAFT_451416 [Xylariaceae sp. FL1651]|nr:hypothetical protein F5Y19DRAFT_451416 [Xylariaceae sp. FL1651]